MVSEGAPPNLHVDLGSHHLIGLQIFQVTSRLADAKAQITTANANQLRPLLVKQLVITLNPRIDRSKPYGAAIRYTLVVSKARSAYFHFGRAASRYY